MDNYTKKMKAKPFDIDANKLIAILKMADAKELGLFPLDRVEISCPRTKRKTACVVDITKTMLKDGEIGIFTDVKEKLGLKKGENVIVRAVPSPESVCFIKKKLDGGTLTEDELKEIVRDLSDNKISEIEAASFVSAVYVHGFSLSETVAMTKALANDGLKIHFNDDIVLDKHCIGGTNGRTTMIIVPIIAAAGFKIPKTSSRSITSSAGTADAMEVLANVSLSIKQIKKITKKVGGVIAWGGALELAPVDDKIIQIEHPLSLDPPGQIIASVMAKKASVGAKYLVIDLPVGPDAKIHSRDRAKDMAKKFIAVGKELGIRVQSVITDGSEPLGRAFGPALEAKYVMETLEGKRFDNLAQKSCELAGVLFEMAHKVKKGRGTAYAKELLTSGKALEKMKEMIKAQGKNVLNSSEICEARFKKVVKATIPGEIGGINMKECANLAKTAGAPANKRAGVMLLVEVGDMVRVGQPLFQIYAENKRKMDLAIKFASKKLIVETEKIILEKFT
ncbi:MAG: AMP phosphorylase [archaeon]|jgi:AMP phosphorylase|nr:AMP phosphorylase [archaeon]